MIHAKSLVDLTVYTESLRTSEDTPVVKLFWMWNRLILIIAWVDLGKNGYEGKIRKWKKLECK